MKISLERLLFSVTALLVTATVGNTEAKAMTFTETFEGFTSGTTVSGPGIFTDFELSAGSEIIFVTSSTPGPDLSGNTIRTLSFSSPYRADFLISRVRAVSVALGDFNQDADNLFLRAFDSSNALIDQVNVFLPGHVFGGPTLSVSSLGDISYVTFGSTGDFPNSVFADNFSYTVSDAAVIPTPALLPGLIGLGAAALRKRKQKAETIIDAEA